MNMLILERTTSVPVQTLNPIVDFVRGDTRKQSNRYSKSVNKSNVPLSSN